jgi:hypothetical protein
VHHQKGARIRPHSADDATADRACTKDKVGKRKESIQCEFALECHGTLEIMKLATLECVFLDLHDTRTLDGEFFALVTSCLSAGLIV